MCLNYWICWFLLEIEELGVFWKFESEWYFSNLRVEDKLVITLNN